jgi:hypothetical protein
MFATLKYGIGREVMVPVSADMVARFSDRSVKEAIEGLLAQAGLDPDGTVPAIREAVADPRSVIELRTAQGYQALEQKAPAGAILNRRDRVEILISLPHAGG